MINIPPHSLIAHRGNSEYFPENTLPAFQAVPEGFWVETDVMLTKDRVPILFHDDDLKRLTGEDLKIADLTYEELMQKDVGIWKGSQFAGTRIPTLAQGLQCFRDKHLSLNLELKPTPGKEIETDINAIMGLRDLKFLKERLVISSFSLEALEVAHKLEPQLSYAWLADSKASLQLGLEASIQWSSINIDNDTLATPEIIQDLLKRNYSVCVFTITSPERAQELFDLGVTAVFANDPGLLEDGLLRSTSQ
jgi:glycerophosphoryl diester phosphodiesterase